MKINWKLRLRNPIFWLTAVPSLTAVIYSVLGLFGIVPRFSEDMLINVITTIITLLSALGVLVDPTTKGLCDSDSVLCGGKKDKNKTD